jgi:prephenate dehydrogenase
VTDAGSAKAIIMEAARALPNRVTFIGGHPMAGSEKTGIAAARADLFAASSYFLTPGPETPQERLEMLRQLVSGLGAKPILVDAERHDRLVAITSHLPHLLAWALCAAAGDMEDPVELAPFLGGAWRDMTRIAGSSPDLWVDILRANTANVTEALRCLTAELGLAGEALGDADRERLVAWLELARNTHERIGES